MGALKDFEREQIDLVLAGCLACGKCYEACPMTVYSPLLEGSGESGQGPDSGKVVGGVLDVLRGGDGSPEAMAWINLCTRSGECVPACPEAVNPKMMMRLARMTAFGGLGGEKKTAVHEDPGYYARIRAFGTLQLTDEEQKEWLK